MKYGIYLETTYNLKGKRKDERIKVKLLMGLRMEMCFTRERFHTRRRRNVLMSTTSNEGENLGDNFRPGLGFGNLLNHLLHVDIFF